jgi:predicted RNA-binding Zn ribbon-like protein
MVFAHDTRMALRAAVALVNTAGRIDELTTVDELAAFYEAWQYTGRLDRTVAELDAVRAVRAPVRELLTSDRDAAVTIINAWLAEAGAVPQLVRHGETDWHVHATRGDEPLDRRILVETAIAMTELVRDDETSRLKVCAARACDGIVLDLTRNRSRVFCSAACTNRMAQAAHRARVAG